MPHVRFCAGMLSNERPYRDQVSISIAPPPYKAGSLTPTDATIPPPKYQPMPLRCSPDVYHIPNRLPLHRISSITAVAVGSQVIPGLTHKGSESYTQAGAEDAGACEISVLPADVRAGRADFRPGLGANGSDA
jgi:hypothetical protein